jgi:hypothetical protein
LEENGKTCMNFSALGIKHKPKPATLVLEADNSTSQNIYEQRIKRIADESVSTSRQRIQEIVDSQQPYIEDFVEMVASSKTKHITTNIISDLIEVRDSLVKDLASQRHALLVESDVKIVELENDLDEFKQSIVEDVTSKYTKLKEAIDATAGSQSNIQKYKSAFEQELKNIKVKLARVAESGGGTNAVQYSNGGYMDGTLTVNGSISASGNLMGSIGLSSLNQESAQNGDVLAWSASNNSWSPETTKHVAIIGNGVDYTFIINHSLSSMDLLYQVYDTNTQEVVWPYIRNIDDQSTFVAFSNIPSASAYRVIIKK